MKRISSELAVLFAVVLTIFWPGRAPAALRTWDGGGPDNLWTSAGNWALNVPPAAGDDLLFPSGAARPVNSNNFPPGTAFRSITLAGGYTLQGALLALDMGITNVAGTDEIQIPITLRQNQTFSASDGVLIIRGDVDTAARVLNFAVSGTAEIQAQTPIVGTGGITKSGPSLLSISGNNSYSGTTEILEGRAAISHNNALGLATAGTILHPGAALGLNGTITITEPLALAGKLIASQTGTNCLWAGPITLASNTAQMDVPSLGFPLSISGTISGTGSLTKIGGGTLWLKANNAYTGPTTNQFGTLIVDGTQPSPVVVGLGAVLTGIGSVGNVTCLEGFTGQQPRIVPGRLGIGRLSVSNLTMSAVAHLAVQLNGTLAGSGYGQLAARGSVNITDAGLDLSITEGFVPPVGVPFVILDNIANGPILGEFRFFPEGTIFNAGGYPFQITYRGGTGNDIVVTRVASITRISSIRPFADGMMLLQVTGGIYSLTYTIQASTNLSPTPNWSDIGYGHADFSGTFSFADQEAPLFPMRFYRVMSP